MIVCIFHELGNKANSCHKPTFFVGIVVWVKISEKSINFSDLRSCYHRLANRKKLILSLEKYFKTLKDMIISTADT